MAYTAANHEAFVERVQKQMVTFQGLLEETETIDQIYINETASGGDPDFVDHSIATSAEVIDTVVFMRAYRDFITGNAVATLDRRPNISPFLQ